MGRLEWKKHCLTINKKKCNGDTFIENSLEDDNDIFQFAQESMNTYVEFSTINSQYSCKNIQLPQILCKCVLYGKSMGLKIREAWVGILTPLSILT